MIFDLFDSPELLDIQRLGFYRFLNEGIPQLLAKEFPIKVKNGRYSMELCLNENDVKLVAPEDSPRDCILKMKTYNCKLYARVKIVCKKSSSFTPSYKYKAPLCFAKGLKDIFWQSQKTRAWHKICTEQSGFLHSTHSEQNTHGTYSTQESNFLLKEKIVYQSSPEWVLLGQIPMMTKRGHFIINGSPRVIVHQVVRAPGIYFQKLIKKDDQSRARYYGDIIPLKGAWVRLQMTKKGRVEVKFKKGKKVEVEFLQKCLQVIENQIFFNSISRSIIAQSFGSRYKSLYTNSEAIQSRTNLFSSFFYKGKALLCNMPYIRTNLRRARNRKGDVSHLRCRQHRIAVLSPKMFVRATNYTNPPEGTQSHQDLYLGKLKRLAKQNFALVGGVKNTQDVHALKNGSALQVASLSLKKSSFEKNIGSILYDDYSKLLDKKTSRAESKAEHDAFVHTYDKLYRTAQDKELEEWQNKKKNQNFFKRSSFSPSPFVSPYAAYKSSYAPLPSGDELAELSTCKGVLRRGRKEICTATQSKVSPPPAVLPDYKSSYMPISSVLPYKSEICLTNSSQGEQKSKKKKIKTELYTGTKEKKLKNKQNSGLSKTKPYNSSFLENAFKRKKCSENLFATFKLESRYDLGLLGREKINTKFGRSLAFLEKNFNESESQPENHLSNSCDLDPCRTFKNLFFLQNKPFVSQNKVFTHTKKFEQTFNKNNNTQLTALDLCSATLWLYKLRKGEQNIDDIDHSQNRRVRTSGELLQTQFENGVSRLKNLLSTKFQEWKGDLSDSNFLEQSKELRSIFKFSCEPLYNRKLFFKAAKKEELSYTEKKSFVSGRRNDFFSKPVPSTTLKNSFSKRYHFFASGEKKGTPSYLLDVPCKTLPKQQGALEHVKNTSSYMDLQTQPFYKGVQHHKGESLQIELQSKALHLAPKLLQTRDLYTPPSAKELFSTKPITGALREFFGVNPLSQYMDQTNPLAEITHKRRISSLGIGGVSRESAGMAIRGIHPTHYGRICPIETPEGKNAGLVNSLAFYTKVDENGFLKTPYYRVFKGQIQSSLGFSFCSAKEELLTGLHIAPSDLQKSSNNILRTQVSRSSRFIASCNQNEEFVPVRAADNLLDVFKKENSYKVQAIAISPIQMISVATSLIPFLEHNDANRALMGSNMQRQAVPLMIAERAVVGTGLESTVIVESGHITESQISGFVSHIAANEIVVDKLFSRKKEKPFLSVNEEILSSWKSLNALRTNLLLLPKRTKSRFVGGITATQSKTFHSMRSMQEGVEKDVCKAQKNKRDIICTKNINPSFKLRGLSTKNRSVLILKEKKSWWHSRLPLLSNPIHFQKDSLLISTVSPLTTFSRSNQNTCITEKPLIREFDWVQKGDILSDCSASNNGELAVGKNVLLAYIPWEGYNFEDAIVISERLVKEHVYTSLHIERYVFQAQDLKDGNEWFTKNLPGVNPDSIQHLDESGLPKIGSFLKEGDIIVGKIRYLNKKPSTPYERLLCDILGEKNFAARNKSLYVPKGVRARVIYHKVISLFDNDPENKVRPLEAPKIVHLFLGEKRVIQVGDKISGRHGNKGVISTILPRQDMPYLPDGTPIDLILNPLGVPSRMNVGQVLECLLGLAASYLNQHFKTSAFDERYGVEASKSIVFLKLYQARLMSGQNWLFQVSFPGKTRLVDGRSGECFDQWITVGKAYILKLIHMVSEKIHARSTGPYALITQQPLRGRSNKGGQRLGEMEVWALEGFGAAYTLQELLTKKSDDFFGRKQIVDSILPTPRSIIDTLKPSYRIDKSKNVLGHPEIFKVLLCELQALCLDLGVYIVTPESFQRTFLGVVH